MPWHQHSIHQQTRPVPVSDNQATGISPKLCWVISSGAAGMENQGLGLAEALQRRIPGLEIVTKHVTLTLPWQTITPYLRSNRLDNITDDSDPLTPPWPDIAIGIGRQSIGPMQALRKQAPATRLVQLQRPTGWLRTLQGLQFDLVVPPVHDRVAPHPVVVESLGALHRVTPEKLAQATEPFAKRISTLRQPRYAVLIGGKSKTHDLTEAALDRLINDLKDLTGVCDCSLMITTSRRTGEDATARLREAFDRKPHWFWDGEAPNPYFAFLAAADAIIMTNDSVSMASEAAATGKPIYQFDLPGGSEKFTRFHTALESRGITMPLPKKPRTPLGIYHYAPLLEADRLATIAIERFGWG